MVTMLYLLYPTVTKATFQLVACQQVGGRLYLQMDLDIPCYQEVHMKWVGNLFIPALLGYVIGLPLMTLMVLYPQRYNLHDRWTRFRFGVLYSGYTDACFYWECTIAARKAAVIVVSVFMTTSGAEAQALCCMMIIMCSMVGHLMFRPFEKVTDEHHTLYWTEFYGLLVAFLTFWTGLFFYQEVAQAKSLQLMFTAELLFVNCLFLVLGVRWFLILKLMDLTDLIDTKKLQGFEDEDLESERCMTSFLIRFVPEWQYVRNLWARRAWQRTVRENILKRRHLIAFSDQNVGKRAKDRRFSLGNTTKLHDDAQRALGLHVANHDSSKLKRPKAKKRLSTRLHQNTTGHNKGVLKATAKLKSKLQRVRHHEKSRSKRQSGTFKAALKLQQKIYHSRAKIHHERDEAASSVIIQHIESLDAAQHLIRKKHLQSRIRLVDRLNRRSILHSEQEIELEHEGADELLVVVPGQGMMRTTSRRNSIQPRRNNSRNSLRRGTIFKKDSIVRETPIQEEGEDVDVTKVVAVQVLKPVSKTIVFSGRKGLSSISKPVVIVSEESKKKTTLLSSSSVTKQGKPTAEPERKTSGKVKSVLTVNTLMKKTKEASIKTGNDLNEYLAMQKEVAKTLPNVNVDVLFMKLDKNKSGGLSKREMARLLLTVNKPLTTKNVMKQVWKALAKNKKEVALIDLKEWINVCVASVISDAGPAPEKKRQQSTLV